MSAKKSFFVSGLIVLIASICSTAANSKLILNQRPADFQKSTFALESDEPALSFDPNNYSFLIYDTQGGEDSIQQAMQMLGITYDLRNAGNPVTLADLQNHDILIVGWNVFGDTDGLNPNVLVAGITGRIILSGHDADYHTVNGPEAGKILLTQAIEYVLAGSGTGLITLGDTNGFAYLPPAWGVSVQVGGSETITAFTADGLASGVYDDLTPNDMCNWGTSYHDTFTAWGSDFVSFELGGTGQDVITIAKTRGCGPPKLTKVDDVNDGDCVGPGREINYTICYNYSNEPNIGDINNVNIIDDLPAAVNFISASDNGNYDPNSRTVTWPLGTLSPGDANCVTLTVEVQYPEPGGTITNHCELKSGEEVYAGASENTPVCCWGGEIIYVKYDADGANNGTSWTDAYIDLQSAFSVAGSCANEIWVAAGIYKPTNQVGGTGDRYKTFQLKNGVAVYGGFVGNETNRNQRDWRTNITILSGDLDGNNSPDPNDVYHVFYHPQAQDPNLNLNSTAVLDGFVITGGNANGSSPHNCGGGMYNFSCSPTITNCTFSGNSAYSAGGGMYNYSSSPTVVNCTFSQNSTFGGEYGGHGGGMYNYGNDPNANVTNCTFAGNSATFGGGMYNYGNDPNANVTNCTFAGNSAVASGGGMYNYQGNSTLTNCILWGNTASDPNNLQIYNNESYPAVSYSDIQGDELYPGTGNIDADPLFVDADNGDLRLQAGSPCIDTGSNVAVPTGITIDLAGEPRIIDGHCDANSVVDMGAYEYYLVGDLNTTCGVDIDDLTLFVSYWLQINCQQPDNCGQADLNRDGMVELADFALFAEHWLEEI
jgi:hypothetical protein